MKSTRTLILATLLLGATPAISFADCSPRCSTGQVCRYDSTRSPQFYCAKETASYVRGPAGPRATQGSSSAIQKSGSPNGSMARTTGPKNNKAQFRPNPTGDGTTQQRKAIQSPRDAASGQATGRRQHKP